jgi:hypothetical protein
MFFNLFWLDNHFRKNLRIPLKNNRKELNIYCCILIFIVLQLLVLCIYKVLSAFYVNL